MTDLDNVYVDKTTGENKKQYSSIHRNNKILQRRYVRVKFFIFIENFKFTNSNITHCRNTAEKIPLKNTKKLIEQEHLEIGKVGKFSLKLIFH